MTQTSFDVPIEPMPDTFIAKLRHGAELTAADVAILLNGISKVDVVGAGRDIVREGERSDRVRLVRSGLACRYKELPKGARSIMAFLLPGDFCDLHVAILNHMDHAISALTPCEVVSIPRSTIEEWTERHPRIHRALWWATLVDEGILRAWLANLGGRRGPERIAHLFCELGLRMESVGLGTAADFSLPLGQQQLGQAVGLSVVHLNRMLGQLRGLDLIAFRGGRVAVSDVKRLRSFASFDPAYLHLERSFPRNGTTDSRTGAPGDSRAA